MRQPSRVSLRDLLAILFRDRWRIASVVIVACIAASAYLAMQSSIYVAESRILVRIGKEKFAGIESYANESHNILFQERGQDIFNEIQILRDPDVAHRVYARLREGVLERSAAADAERAWYDVGALVASAKALLRAPLVRFGLVFELSDEEAMVQALSAALAVEAIEDTDVLRVSLAWPDPEFAAHALNIFVDEFLAKHIRVSENTQSESFYRRQIALKQSALDEANQLLMQFRLDRDLSNLPQQLDRMLTDIADLDARLRELDLEVEGYAALRTGVEQVLASGAEWIQTPEFAGRVELNLGVLDKEYFDLVAQRSQLGAVHTDKAREMVLLNDRMRRLRARKAGALIEYFAMNSSILLEQRKAMVAKREALDARVRDVNQAAVVLAGLERNVVVAEQNYLNYRNKAEELRVSDLLSKSRISGVRVISEARAPVAPSFPRRGLILGLAALIGLFLGIAYSAIAEYFNHTFRDAEDVERVLGTRLLMSVPRVRSVKP